MATRVRGGAKLAAFIRKAKSAKARSKGVEVGFFATARYPDVDTGKNGGGARKPHPVAQVAAWMEFGVPSMNIDERPFFRNAIRGAGRVIDPIMKAGIDPKDMALGEQTASLIGEVMKARIQSSIVSLRSPKNADITIKGGWMRNPKSGKLFRVKGKGSSNPLIDTGTLKGSVTYAVTDPPDSA